jgi:hypothetical protein
VANDDNHICMTHPALLKVSIESMVFDDLVDSWAEEARSWELRRPLVIRCVHLSCYDHADGSRREPVCPPASIYVFAALVAVSHLELHEMPRVVPPARGSTTRSCPTRSHGHESRMLSDIGACNLLPAQPILFQSSSSKRHCHNHATAGSRVSRAFSAW